MKPLAIVCAALLASAAVSSSALAASNLNSSKSNLQKIDGKGGLTEAGCIEKGGTVSTDQEGNKVCAMPEAGLAVTDPESSDVGRGDSK